MKLTQPLFDKLKNLDHAILDNKGREMLSPVPADFNTTLDRPPSLVEQIKRVVKIELDDEARKQGMESFEQADDFDVDDDFDIEALGRYELIEMIPEMPIEKEVIQDEPVNAEPSPEPPKPAVQDSPAEPAS